MPDKPQTSGLDYGHRTYMDADDYMSSMSRPSDKAIDNQVKRPHSDDKKPYMDDDYPEMEYHWTPYDPPNFIPPGIPDDPRIVLPPGYPGFVRDPHKDPQAPPFLGCLFGIPVGKTVILSGETNWRGLGFLADDPIARLYVNYGPVKLLTDVKTINNCLNLPIAKCIVSAIALDGVSPDDYIRIGDYCLVQIVAVTRARIVCTWEFFVVLCPPLIPLAYDYENSAETIARGGSADIYVTDGATPFTWTVEGEGYTLAQAKTTGRHNTLFANGSSCGAAIITVVDGCHAEVEASLRNTTSGKWVEYEDVCGAPFVDDVWSYSQLFGYGGMWGDKTIGYQRQTHYHSFDFASGGNYETEADCLEAYNDCGAASASRCMPYPSRMVIATQAYAGTYYKCGASKNYHKTCRFTSTYYGGYWHFAKLIPRVDEDTWVSYLYYEWECP